MKRKLCIFTFIGLVASTLAACAQNNPPAADAAVPNTAPASTNEVAQAQPAPDASAATNAPAASTNAPVADASAPSTMHPPLRSPQRPRRRSPRRLTRPHRAPQPGAVIPLIVMDDVPLTDAIKNLARQAGLNYMLDPKVAFGQVGPGWQTDPPANRVNPMGKRDSRTSSHRTPRQL